MRIFVDTASLSEIEEWAGHSWVSGFTTNPTLMRNAGAGVQPDVIATTMPGAKASSAMDWAKRGVEAAAGKPISIDGPPEVWDLGDNVWRKVAEYPEGPWNKTPRQNYTALCSVGQLKRSDGFQRLHPEMIASVFAGRIMDTGRDPQPVIDAAKQTGAQVLWASVREPYNIIQAERAGCDIVTVPPAILRKWLDWHGKPLEVVAQETIAQFDKDREGLW